MYPDGMAYKDRLQKSLELAGKTVPELARYLEVSPQAIYQQLKGGKSGDGQMYAENSAKTARFLKVDHFWLATGIGEARPQNAPSETAMALAHRFDKMTDEQQQTIRTLMSVYAPPAPDKRVEQFITPPPK